MAIHDTTNIIDSSIYLKAKLDKNMVGTNYYIENLQARRDADWDYRYNVVGIEEELYKQIEYSTENPMYTPIDAVVTNIKNPLSDEESNGTLSIAFKDLAHPCDEGYRYRFSTDFPDMTKLTEDEKHYSTNIWLAVNHSSVKPGNSVTVKRCNTSFAMVGSPTNSLDNITEVHYEPVVLENKILMVFVHREVFEKISL